QIFSPVVRFETVRMLLALATIENWHLSGLDVKSAFLYGDLDEEIYMEQPEGFRVPGSGNTVFRLRKALYGLKQAALSWWRALSKSMEQLGFQRMLTDASIFIRRTKNGLVIAIIYVDDALFLGPDLELIEAVKRQFMKLWECRDLGNAKEYLRMRIHRKGQ